MNALTRAHNQPALASNSLLFTLHFPRLRMIILFVALLVSSFSIVYIKDLNRRLFIQYQDLQQVNSDINVNYSKLLLEESAWSTQSRIQSIAENQLNMEVPSSNNIIMLKLN